MDNHTDFTSGEAEIAKYLSGEANPEEAMQLEEWITSSGTNRDLFSQYQEINSNLKEEKGYRAPSSAEAWSRLENALPGLKRKKHSTPFKRLFTKYGMAASIAGIILLSAAAYFYLNPGSKATTREITFVAINSSERKILPDSSEIVLSTNSSLSFPEHFKPGSRETYLQGEAYFTITPNPAQPFIISVDNIKIQVIGTSFNVENIKAKGTIETQVTTGKVKMYNNNGEVIIRAGQTGIYDKNRNSFFIEDTLRINRFGYATRKFNFVDENLSSIITYLEKAYSRKIILDIPQLGDCKMTSSFENKSIEYVLEVIAATLNLTFKINNEVIHIGGDHDGC